MKLSEHFPLTAALGKTICDGELDFDEWFQHADAEEVEQLSRVESVLKTLGEKITAWINSDPGTEEVDGIDPEHVKILNWYERNF